MARKKSGGGTKIGVEFGANAAPFKQAMAEISHDLKQGNLDFKLLAAEGGAEWEKSMDGLTAKSGMLESQILDQQRQVETLTKEYDRQVASSGATSKEAMKLSEDITKAKIAEANMQTQLNKTNDELNKQQKALETGEKSATGMEKVMGLLSKATGGASDSLVSAVASGNLWAAALEKSVEVAGQVISKVNEMAKEIDDAYDSILINTGAAGQELDGLNDSFMDVFTSGANAIGDVSFAISDYNTRLGYTGDALESLSKLTLDLSRMTGSDLKANIRETSAIVQQYNMTNEQAEAYLDAVFVTSQKTGIGITELGQKVNNNTALMKQYGIALSTQIAWTGALEKAGIDATQAMRGLGTKLGELAEAGKDPEKAFNAMFKAIKNTKDEQQGLALAVDYFGNRAGPKMFEAIRNGVLDIDDLTVAITGSSGAIADTVKETDGFWETLTEIQNLITGALAPAIDTLFKMFDTLLQPIKLVFEGIQNLASAFQPLVEKVGGLWDALGDLYNTLTGGVGPAMEGFGSLLELILKPLELVIDAVTWLVNGLNDFGSAVGSVFGLSGQTIDEFEKKSGNALDSMQKSVKATGAAVEDTYDTVSKESRRAGESLDEYERRLAKAAKAAENHAALMRLSAMQADYGSSLVSQISYRRDGSVGYTFANADAAQYYYNNANKYANGTDYHPGGVATVGERGPEKVYLPRGSQVRSAEDSAYEGQSGGAPLIVQFDKVNDVVKLMRTASMSRRMARMRSPGVLV